MILTNDGLDYLIEPVIGHVPTESKANPHLVYRADHVRKARSLGSENRQLPCGTTGRILPTFYDIYRRNPHNETAFIRTLRLKYHCLSPLNKNPKKAEMGMDLT